MNGPFSDFLPSDEWQHPPVHWHGYHEIHPKGSADSRAGDRHRRLARVPDAVLHSPWQVADWIDKRTRAHVLHAEVFAHHDQMWVSIGDEDDLSHLRRENYEIASRGDSIYTDIYTENDQHHLYLEAVTDVQCRHSCVEHTHPAEPDGGSPDPAADTDANGAEPEPGTS